MTPYTFALSAIAQGRTVLIYSWPRCKPVRHVKTSDRLALVDGVLWVDGVSTKGMTVCLKP